MSCSSLLNRMRERGINPREKHTYDFYLLLPAENVSDIILEFAEGLGCSVTLMSGVKKGTWFCIVSKTFPSGIFRDWRDYVFLVAAAGEILQHLARKEGGYLHGLEIDMPKP